MIPVEELLEVRIREAIGRLLDTPWTDGVPVERSNRPDLGDYASPVAFQLAGRLRRAPLEIAQELADDLDASEPDVIAAATASAPAFLNIRLSAAFLGSVLAEAIDRNGRLADSDALEGTKIVVEHTNINPNKAAHVGHFRNACLGDTVSRMLDRRGADVEVQNYIDDTGVQVADVVVGLLHLDVPAPGDQPFDQYCSQVYVDVQRAYEDDPRLLERRSEVQHAIESGEGELAERALATAQRVAACNLDTMARARISYDLLTWESDILALGFWEQAFQRLKERGVIRLEDEGPNAGCWVVPFGVGTVETDRGTVTEDKVLVTSRDTVTYTAKDIAYQMWKFGVLGRDFRYRRWGERPDGGTLWSSTSGEGETEHPAFAGGDRVINVIDDRQSYPQQVVYDCLRRMGYEGEADASEHLAYAVVSLSPESAAELGVEVDDDVQKVAMSGRGGIQIYADQLLDRLAERIARRTDDETAEAVATAAARYYMLKFGTTQEIVFDFDEALRTTGETGVYLLYAVVRAAGIRRKLDAEGIDIGAHPPPDPMPGPDREVLLRMAHYPERLAEAASERSPLVLAKYAFELAATFNTFYDNTPPVISEEDAMLKSWRAGLVVAAQAVLTDVLEVLGMPTVEQI